MAAPVTLKFGKLLVLLENPATPTVFAAPCGFTEKALSLSKSLTDVTVPDCLDPDAPAFVGREVASQSASITGSGVMALEALETWRDFMQDTNSWNVRVELVAATAGTGGGYYSMKAHLESFEVSATLGEKVQVSVSMQSDGAWTWTDV